MNKAFLIAVKSLCAAMLCASAWAADVQPLNVKTGQWETTLTGQTSGTPPIPEEVLRRLTPEQRAQVEQAIQSKGASGTKTVTKGCLTKEKLAKPYSLDSTKSCSLTLLSSSATKQEVQVDCSHGSVKSTGTVKVEAFDSEHLKGEMQMTATGQDHTMKTNYTFTSKWIGAACSQK